MDNPFQINYPDQIDTDLVKLSIEGDKTALQNLILRHQMFVYNLALKMTRNVEDAEDLTQEVFVKAITALSKFEGRSKFRTWLYRITVNHFLNARKKTTELSVIDFESYFNSIDNIPNSKLTVQEESDLSETIEEIRINCTAGMLLCLDREQRLVYILGEMFDIDHHLASEIMGISAGNFRIRLMRAREDLYNWMNEKCGLVNKNNPCRCSKKTKGFIKAGVVDPGDLKFNTRYKQKILELSAQMATQITDSVEDLNKKIFQSHPFQEPLTPNKIMHEILNNKLMQFVLKS
ncbi:MAG TPA: RNA polymerase sigma factor [Chitinophagaceae bacterium]|jgi:RNA polymerase sigma factor (sigma-70 family)|nr:RNA polymerase sigma factor [Chitinophagaceae bacterium]